MPLTERIDNDFLNNLTNLIYESEGWKNELYYDNASIKKATIGIGFNVEVQENLKRVCEQIYANPKMSEEKIQGLYNTIINVRDKTNEGLQNAVENYLKTITIQKNGLKIRKFHSFKFSGNSVKITDTKRNVLLIFINDRIINLNNKIKDSQITRFNTITHETRRFQNDKNIIYYSKHSITKSKFECRI